MTVIALPVSGKKSSEVTEEEENRTELELKLENFLSNVDGVGKVQVLMMTGEGEESQSFYSSKREQVTGVLVCAQGADDATVCRKIVEGVMALFQIDAHKIRVMKMK